jgi:UPF0042 nucleotide-binding protein
MTTVPETRPTGPRAGTASFVLVTGPSGAGRSTAVRALEDMGCETIDNLPLSLIPRLSEGGALVRPLILGIDVRNRDFSVAAFLDTVDWLRGHGAEVEVLYLDCAPDVLTRRYSETRRRHPLAPAETPAQGIEREIDLLVPIRAQADIVIDTTELSPHELRAELARWFDPAHGADAAFLQLQARHPPRSRHGLRRALPQQSLLGPRPSPARRPRHPRRRLRRRR